MLRRGLGKNREVISVVARVLWTGAWRDWPFFASESGVKKVKSLILRVIACICVSIVVHWVCHWLNSIRIATFCGFAIFEHVYFVRSNWDRAGQAERIHRCLTTDAIALHPGIPSGAMATALQCVGHLTDAGAHRRAQRRGPCDRLVEFKFVLRIYRCKVPVFIVLMSERQR
jgi:hypothetical protein